MDGELPPWDEHGSHNSRVPYNTAAEEHLESHGLIGDISATGGSISSLSSCMSGAFRALIPDHHETSSALTTNPYSPDNHCLVKPGTVMDENVDSASVTHMLPTRCVPQKKDQELDQGTCNWTSVIKDALEMSNGVEMEQTLSMDVCAPHMDFNPGYKGAEAINDHYRIAESKLIENQDGQGGEADSFISALSDDVLVMGKTSSLDVGSTEDVSTDSFIEGNANSSFEPTLQTTKGCERPRKEVSPRKHSTANNRTLHHHDPQNVTDGTDSVKSLDVQDKANISILEVAETTLAKNPALVKYEISKELGLKVEAEFAPETVRDQPVDMNKSQSAHTQESRQVNELCLQENNSTTDECNIHIQEKQTLKSPSGAKGRKRKKTELELLFEPIYHKKDESDTPGATDHDSSALKEEDLVANGDANPPSSERKSCQRVSHIELVTDTADTSDHICSEATQEKAQSSARIRRKTGSKRKQKRRRSSVTLDSQCLSPSHSKLSNTTLVNEGSNVANTQDSSIAEAKSPKKSLKKKTSASENVSSSELLNPCFEPTNTTEADASVVQPTIRSFRARKTLELNSTAESVSAEESDYSGVRQRKTENTPSKRRKTAKYMEAQTSPLDLDQEKPSLLSGETQENSVSKTGSSSSSGSTRKAANKIKEEAEEMIVTQHDSSPMAKKASKKCKKMSDVKDAHIDDQTSQQEVHPFDPYAATEIDNFDGDYQKKARRPVKRAKANKRIKKRTSLRNIPSEDLAEHPPISSGKDVTQSSPVIVHENQVSITTEVSSPSSVKKTRRKQSFEQKEINVPEQDDLSKHIGETVGFGNTSLTEEKNIMVTQVQVFSKLPDGQTVRPEPNEKDVVDETRTTVRKASKKSPKAARKKVLTQTVKEEEIDTRLVETLTFTQTTDVEQKPRKRGRPPLNKSTISSDINECNTSLTGEDQETVQKRKRGRPALNKISTECLGEALSSTMPTVDCEEITQRRGRPLKNNKQGISSAHSEDNRSPSQDDMDDNITVTEDSSQPLLAKRKDKIFKKPKLSHFFPQNSTEVYGDEGTTSLSTVQDGGVLADIEVENKERKRGQKRRRIKQPSLDQSLIVTSESSVEVIPETCKRYKVEKRSAGQSSKRPKRKMLRSKPKEMVKKPLTCKYCTISFRHITAYTIHQRIHTGDKPYKCKICGKTFAQRWKLRTHRNTHDQDSSFPCPCCNRRFVRKDHLIRHFKIHVRESNTKYRCLICKENFVNQVKLQNHMRTHDTEKALLCKECGKKFLNPSSLAAHEKKHWPVKPYACSICGKGFNLLKALKRHSQDHAGETPFSCFHCGHAFRDLPALRKHQASKTCIARKNNDTSDSVEGFIVSQGVDGQVNTPVFFRCQICKQLFRKWCQYTLHLQTHTSSPPYICFSCGQCYEKDSEMNVHCEVCCLSSGEEKICGASLPDIMRGVPQTSSQSPPSTGIQQNPPLPTSSEHPINSTSTSSSEINPSLWKFKCCRCGQRFKQYRSLGVHLQTHAPGFRYACTHCGQFFERWSKLWLHQRHHGLKSRCYSCNQCNLQFRFYSSFKEHMIDHTGNRPYVCTLCPKTFIQEASLHAHQCESHKPRKSLKCDVCSKTFSSLANLIKHSFLHPGSTSHVCLSCDLPFTNSRLLREHLKTHTADAGPALPDIPLEPLSFPHKCKRCIASFSTGDLLFAHQICHSRDAKTQAATSKSSDPQTPSTQRNPLSDLKLDSIPNDASLYLYSHPDKLYVPPTNKVQPPVINLDPDEQVASESRSTRPDLPNDEITATDSQNTHPELTSQSDSMGSDSQSTRPELPNGTHLPQADLPSDLETTKQNLSVMEMEDEEDNCSRKYKTRSTVRNVDMESEESFECADCTEKLTSVLSLYEHYILHALGDTYVH